MQPHIEQIEINVAPARAALMDIIDVFNDAQTGLTEPVQHLALVIRDPKGKITGGLSGVSYYGWLFIDHLVLPEPLRRQGLGTSLMQQAEAVAKTRGCIGIWLDTFSFQAPEFYQKLGFTVFGEIPDYPQGQSRFYLAKRLTV